MRGPTPLHLGDPPTERQREILRAIESFTDARGYPPTLREIGDTVGIRSTNGVVEHLRLLRKRGLVTWVPRASRTLQLTPEGVAAR